MKTWLIHDQMVSEGKIASHAIHLKVGTVLIIIGYLFNSILGTWASVIQFLGLSVYLYVLYMMRKNNGPAATGRIFWSQIASFTMGIVIIILAYCMIQAMAQAIVAETQRQIESSMGSSGIPSTGGTGFGFGSGGGTPFSTQQPAININTQDPRKVAADTADAIWMAAKGYLVAIVTCMVVSKYLTLLTTGHSFLDVLNKPLYTNFSDEYEERAPRELENSVAGLSVTDQTTMNT
jgi:uncharacterized membrane protein YhdT